MTGATAVGLAFWLLMTSDLSFVNIAIGLAGSAAITWLADTRISAPKILKAMLKVMFFTLPLALFQAIYLISVSHPVEETEWEALPKGSPDTWNILTRIFEITLTPLTLALDTDDRGRIKVHLLKRIGTREK